MHSTTQNVGPRKYSPFDQAEAASTMQYTFGAMHIGKNFRICLCWKSMSLLGCPDRFTDSNLRRVSPLGAQLWAQRRRRSEVRTFFCCDKYLESGIFSTTFPKTHADTLAFELWILMQNPSEVILLDFLGLLATWHPHPRGLQCARDKFKIQVLCSSVLWNVTVVFTKSVTPALDTDDWVHG